MIGTQLHKQWQFRIPIQNNESPILKQFKYLLQLQEHCLLQNSNLYSKIRIFLDCGAFFFFFFFPEGSIKMSPFLWKWSCYYLIRPASEWFVDLWTAGWNSISSSRISELRKSEGKKKRMSFHKGVGKQYVSDECYLMHLQQLKDTLFHSLFTVHL